MIIIGAILAYVIISVVFTVSACMLSSMVSRREERLAGVIVQESVSRERPHERPQGAATLV